MDSIDRGTNRATENTMMSSAIGELRESLCELFNVHSPDKMLARGPNMHLQNQEIK